MEDEFPPKFNFFENKIKKFFDNNIDFNNPSKTSFVNDNKNFFTENEYFLSKDKDNEISIDRKFDLFNNKSFYN